MKRILLIGFCALALAACQKENKFTVEGTIAGAQDSTLYLYHRSMSGIVLLDSTRAGNGGAFSISAPAPVGGPDLYVLRLGSQWVNLAVDSTETVTLKASLPGMAQNYTVSGSDECEKIRQLAAMHSELQQRVFALEQNTALMGQVMVDSLRSMIHDYKSHVTTDYIISNPQSASAYFALSQTLSHLYWATSPIYVLGDSADNVCYRAVATCWKSYYPESERAQQLYNMVERDIQNNRIVAARQRQIAEEAVVYESDLIDLSLPDVDDRQRTLSELRGQVVLLDFHLFSAPESGARILKLRELYDRYHSRGLEIYQVSVDQDAHLWRQAVLSLPWISVYDPTGASLMSYNVGALPEFFLIDRQNALQKRSTQMDDVEAEIERLL